MKKYIFLLLSFIFVGIAFWNNLYLNDVKENWYLSWNDLYINISWSSSSFFADEFLNYLYITWNDNFFTGVTVEQGFEEMFYTWLEIKIVDWLNVYVTWWILFVDYSLITWNQIVYTWEINQSWFNDVSFTPIMTDFWQNLVTVFISNYKGILIILWVILVFLTIRWILLYFYRKR